jgi:hypothetical protein
MSCEWIAERLPWLLNQTLKPSERQAVEDHLAGCDSCRQELQETRDAARIFAQHIPHEVLVDFAFGQAHPFISEERIRQNLESCPACRDDLSLIRCSESRMYEEEDRPADGVAQRTFLRSSRRARAVRWRRLAAVAATLVGTVLGLGWGRTWLALQELRSVEQIGPQPGDPVCQIYLSSEVTRSDSPDKAVSKSWPFPAVNLLTLGMSDDMELKLELLSENGRTILELDGIRLTKGEYSFYIPGQLEIGRYEVRLSGSQNGAPVVETFEFSVVE